MEIKIEIPEYVLKECRAIGMDDEYIEEKYLMDFFGVIYTNYGDLPFIKEWLTEVDAYNRAADIMVKNKMLQEGKYGTIH